jgi:hypothetical protein
MMSTAMTSFGIDKYAAVRNNIRSGANSLLQPDEGDDTMASGLSRNRRVEAFVRQPLFNEVFQVHDIRRVSGKYLNRFVMTLTGLGRRFEAIAGPGAAAFTAGDLVRLRGCLLSRRGALVLVVSSLQPISCLMQDESEGSKWK